MKFFMYIVVIAWLYVVLMMSVAEATNTTGTVLGAVITFVMYGLAPLSIVVYIMGTPARKRRLQARAQQELEEMQAMQADPTSQALPASPTAPAAPAAADTGPLSAAPEQATASSNQTTSEAVADPNRSGHAPGSP